MSETGPSEASVHDTLSSEDTKLLVLARSAAARSHAATASGTAGAAVRDDIGRTYVAGAVAIGPLRLTAVQAAVAQAAASGVTRLEAVAVVGDEDVEPALLSAVGDPVLVRE